MLSHSIPSARASYTALPATLAERQAKAEGFLDRCAGFTEYRHRRHNPYLHWLKANPRLEPDFMYRFFNYWYPASRHQPQILLQVAAAYQEWSDRKLVFDNYKEEDGMARPGDDPHYVLLERFIVKLGGQLNVDAEAEQLVSKFHKSSVGMTAAEATGYVAASNTRRSTSPITSAKSLGSPGEPSCCSPVHPRRSGTESHHLVARARPRPDGGRDQAEATALFQRRSHRCIPEGNVVLE